MILANNSLQHPQDTHSASDIYAKNLIVPIQPDLTAKVSDYKQALRAINPFIPEHQALFFEFRTAKQSPCVVEMIPDDCVEFLFDCSNPTGQATISGFLYKTRSRTLLPDTLYFGFKPYTAKDILAPSEFNWSEISNEMIPFETLFYYPELSEGLRLAKNFEERIALFSDFAAKHLVISDYTPDFVDYFEMKMCRSRGLISLDDIVSYTGYSERYCRNKFKDYCGLSIKGYNEILRIQNVARMLLRKTDEMSLQDIVFENGFYDQAHLNHAFRKYFDSSPLAFTKKFALQEE